MEQVILLADNSYDRINQLQFVLNRHGYKSKAITTRRGLTQALRSEDRPCLIVSCSFLENQNDLDFSRIQSIVPNARIIISYKYSQIEQARRAERKGAVDSLMQPFEVRELLHKIQQRFLPTKENSTKGISKNTKKYIVGESAWATQMQKQIKLVAPTDMSVIIEGESGTGKEVAARAIVYNSRRKTRPFITLDCGAIPKELAGSELFGHVKGAFTGALSSKKGSFELAHRGTLFLDEIGNLSYQNQIKLLRVLQEGVVKPIGSEKQKVVNVRVIAATNESLKELVAKGEFREDLYHRLNEFNLTLAPIRNRKEDIPLFLNHFLRGANEKLQTSIKGFDKIALSKLQKYSWPGNLREMKNVVRRAALLSDDSTIKLKHLPNELISGGTDSMESIANNAIQPLKMVVAKAEKKAILDALEVCNWNKSLTAQKLEIKRRTLYNKMELYGISV